jgi:hypothetical protein
LDIARNCGHYDRQARKCATDNSGDNQRASKGKKTDEGTMMLLAEPKSNSLIIAEPPETQTLIPATTNPDQLENLV